MLVTEYVREEVRLGKTYVVVNTDEQADEVAVKTILYSKPPFVPPITVTLVNGEQMLSCDVTADGFVRLSDLTKSLTPVDFLVFMKNFTETFIKSPDYFLEPFNFSTENEHIFINPVNCAVRLIYLPFCKPVSSEGEVCRQIYNLAQVLSRRFSSNSNDLKWQEVKAHLYDMSETTTIYDANIKYADLCAKYSPRPMVAQSEVKRMKKEVNPPLAPKPGATPPRNEPVRPKPKSADEWVFGDDIKPQKPQKGFLGGLFAKKEKPGTPAPKKEKKSKSKSKAADNVFDYEKTSVFANEGVTGAFNQSTPMLYLMENGTKTTATPVTSAAFVLGRSTDANYCFNSETDRNISRTHALISFDGGRYYVTDKHSSGGTFLNGRRITPNSPQQLDSGNIIKIGGRELMFEV